LLKPTEAAAAARVKVQIVKQEGSLDGKAEGRKERKKDLAAGSAAAVLDLARLARDISKSAKNGMSERGPRIT
jgi:hypothetical protein